MHVFDLNLRHLRAIAATCETGSISAAAAAIALSQPAVTQGVAKVEATVGALLFERRASGMTPTEAGRLLCARARAADAALARGFADLRKGAGGAHHRLVTATQLRAFLSLADAGSYVAAARATGLSQPSLHRAIRDLERSCGVPLVERRGRGVRIGEAGARLLRGFRLAAAELEAGLTEVAALAGPPAGRVRVGAMPLARAQLIPVAAARFHGRFPHVGIEIAEGSHRELIEALRDGRLDLLVGALRPPEPDVVQEALFTDRLLVVARRDHPLAGDPAPHPHVLSAYPWVMAREGTPLRAQWAQLFVDAGLPPPPAPVTCGSVMAIRTLLTQGNFLTLLSREQIRVELAAGLLTAIGPPLEATRRVIGMTTRAGWMRSATQAAFVDTLRACAVEPALPES